MKVVDQGGVAEHFQKLLLWADEVVIATAWASHRHPSADLLAAYRDKVTLLLVGTHFDQTHPIFLSEWMFPTTPLRVVKGSGDVFHPKGYAFRKGKKYAALVGSWNFTGGGFGANAELGVALDGTDAEAVWNEVVGLATVVDAAKFSPGKKWDEWLKRYRTRWLRRPRPGRATRPAADSPDIDVLDPAVAWDDWLDLLLHAHEWRPDAHPIRGWLVTLRYLRALPKIGDLSLVEWRELIGTRRRVEGHEDIDLGWFGGVRSGPKVKAVFPGKRKRVSTAVSAIPKTGPLTEEAWEEFCARFDRLGLESGIGLASRLLTVRRPDLFFSANKAAQRGIYVHTGVVVQDLATYRQALDVVWSWPWADPSAKPPKGAKAREVWNARVALLDVLFYAA